MPFVDYVRIAGDRSKSLEGDLARRSEWSADELTAGVVTHAMNSLAALLDPDFTPAVHEISEKVWSISRSIVYKDCRLHILGTTEMAIMPARLLSEAADKAREAITLCVLPGVGLEFVDLRTPVSVDVKTAVIPLYPNDIDALAADRATIDQLIEYKLFRRILAERPDVETQYVERIFLEYGCGISPHPELLSTLDRAIETRGESESEWLEHPYLQQVDSQIGRLRHTLLFGYSSTGKSILTFQVGRRRSSAGWHVRYVNLSDDISFPAGLIQDLLFKLTNGSPKGTSPRIFDQLVIIDDLQSRPPLARLFLALGSLLHRVRERMRPVFLGVSWNEFASEAAQLCPEVAPVAVHAYLVRDRLLEKYSQSIDKDTIVAIAKEAGDDLYLLRLALEVTARQKAPAGRQEVAEDVWHLKVPSGDRPIMSEAARRVALLTGAIGQFDIHVQPDFIQRVAKVESRVISQLMESRLLRRIGDRVTLGHRSLCALIAWWLGNNGAWSELEAVGGPGDVPSAVFAYLEASGTTAMIDAIRALVARAGFKSRDALSQRAAVIMDLWRAFDAVVEKVERQQASDPTWGKTPSSSVFVTILLSEIGKAELARPSIEFLRSHWRESGGHLEIDTSGLSTVVDFDIIRQRMLDQDKESSPEQETALEIDIERFHKTWLLGLILGAEAAAERPAVPLEHLASLVEEQQLGGSGAFYPHRVPWVSARVLLGLAACGRSIDTSRVVSRIVEWLLLDRTKGGASSGGIWEAGTGSWNSPIETTALVILGVVRAGLDPSDVRLEQGREYLLSERANWEKLEGAVAIEALLASGTKWEEIASDTARLAQRALDQSLWLRATLPADEILEQTCHVAQAATHLVGIGWTAIQADLEELLKALDLPTEPSQSEDQLAEALTMEADASPDQAISDKQSTPDELVNRILAITELPLSRFRVVGDYLRFDDQARTKLQNQYRVIKKALEQKSTRRENHLIWASPGTGKTYFVTEIARAMGEDFARDSFRRLNLSELSKDAFLSEINQLALRGTKPTLCMIDEIEGRSTEEWPYESLYSCLDWNTEADRHIVFVLAGSGGRGLNGMIGKIRDRSRGPDLVDRIPDDNRFEIPNLVPEDRLVVFAKQVLIAAEAKHQDVSEIERLALYYVLKSENLSTLRQLSELAKSAVAKMEASDGRLLYNHLFRMENPQLMMFFAMNMESAARLQGTFVLVSN